MGASRMETEVQCTVKSKDAVPSRRGMRRGSREIACRINWLPHDEPQSRRGWKKKCRWIPGTIEVVRSPSYAGAGRKSLRADEGWYVEDATRV